MLVGLALGFKRVVPLLPPALTSVATARIPMALELWGWSEREINLEVGGGGRWEEGGNRWVGGRWEGGREKFWGREEVEKN